MDQNELIANIVVLVVAVLAGLGGYFRSRKPPPTSESLNIFTGGIFNRADTERFLTAMETCARSQAQMSSALAAIADKRADEVDDKLEKLMDKVSQIAPTDRRR